MKKRIVIYMDEELHRALKQRLYDEWKSVSGWIREMATAYLNGAHIHLAGRSNEEETKKEK